MTLVAADRRSPAGVVQALYEEISGPVDAPQDWVRVRALFTNSARLRVQFTSAEGSAQTKSWTPAEFAAEADEDYRRRGGFWENGIAGRTLRFGSIAQVWSVYESRQGSEKSEPFARGINSIQLVLEDEGWAIDYLIWDIDQPYNPVPHEHLRRGAEL